MVYGDKTNNNNKNSCRSRWWWGLNPVWFLKALSSLQSPFPPHFLPSSQYWWNPAWCVFPSTTAQFVYLACLCLSLGQLLQWLQTPSLNSPQGDGCWAGTVAFLFTYPKCIHSLILIPCVFLPLLFHILPIPWIVLSLVISLCCIVGIVESTWVFRTSAFSHVSVLEP